VRLQFLFLAGILGAVLPLLAGEVTLTGRVVDENDAGVSRARILLRPAGQHEASSSFLKAVTGPTGAFSLRLASPGSYLVSAECEGYFPLKDHAVQVSAEEPELHLVLNHVREVRQSVNVTASASPIDFDRTSSQTTLTSAEIINIPYNVTRDLRSAIRAMPGVVMDPRGELHFNGGAENQVLYMLDGFNISDPLGGQFHTKLSVEAVRSLEYSSGRFSPEFGKGSAGALALQTTLGDDQLRYSATNFLPGIDTQKGLHIGNFSPRFNLSGPLVRGRAWFSDSVDGEYSTFVVSGLPKGQDRTNTVRGDNLLHNQINLTPSNILYTDFLVNYLYASGTGLSPLDPPSTTTDRRSRTWFFSVKDQIYLGRDMLLEIGYAEDRTFFRQIPQGNALYIMTPNGKRGNFFIDMTQKARRGQFLANLFLPSFHLGGTHQIKAGADADRLDYWQHARRSGFEQFGLSGNLLWTTTFAGNGTFSRPSMEASSYLLDAWRVKPNLLVEVGGRQDWDELVRRHSFSPRFSFTYAPFRAKNTKISGGYAVIYDATSLQLFTRPLDQYSVTTTYNRDGTIAGGPALNVYTIQNPHLARPRYQNWSAGVEHALPHSIFLSVNLLRKRGRDGFTYINTLGPDHPPPQELKAIYNRSMFDGIYNLTNLRRDIYDSAEVTVRQPIRDQYEWMASYTRSRALSTAVFNISIDQPLLIADNAGRMPWDSPNRLLSWAYLPTPRKNWAVAYLLEMRDGFPYSIQDERGAVLGAVNGYRYPMFFSLNLHLERQFRFRSYRFALRGGFNNITGHNNPTVVNNIAGSPNFGKLYGSDGRHFVFRLRWLGKE
jgi:hypothetical protein